jgi:hypothetical protein
MLQMQQMIHFRGIKNESLKSVWIMLFEFGLCGTELLDSTPSICATLRHLRWNAEHKIQNDLHQLQLINIHVRVSHWEIYDSSGEHDDLAVQNAYKY